VSAQDAIVRALAEPSFYTQPPATVRHHQTHISHVFVAGPFAYKLKKAVKFSFADFSTPALRRTMCDEEVRLNRRLCAPLYLGVRSVTRAADGTLALDGAGTPVDALVWMRALPERGMLTGALDEGRVSAGLMADFARALARFHASPETALADTDPDAASPELLCERWRRVMADAAPMVGTLLGAADHAVLDDFGPSFVNRHESLLRSRGPAGRVRDGHGDLHAGNLCLVEEPLPAIDGAPRVEPGLYAFDCLEFSRQLRAGDVAAEVAFLAMDLTVREQAALAAAFVDAYVAATGDDELRLLLAFYGCHRACIRGMVLGLAARADDATQDERADAARRGALHFAHATRLAWAAAGPALVLCGGLSGSGKTTLAVALARSTGFRLLSSDALRKQRAGLDPYQRTPQGLTATLYGADARAAVYQALAEDAGQAVRAGDAVIVDATFQRRTERQQLLEVARRWRVPCLVLECIADEATVRARLDERARRPQASAAGQPALSDAGFEIYLAQRAQAEPPGDDEPAIRIDTAATPDEVEARALRVLWSWRRTQPARAPLKLDA
jgi:aminoglycoside phosphotransferase family enzyme/predicted kinase